MQTEKELNKALSEIYSDLEKLQSAREQVEIVTENSRELTSATSILLKELREFSNQFGKENSSNISQLTKSLSDFENKINKVSEKGNQSISEYIESFKKQIVGVIEQFSKQLSDNEKNLNAISNLNNEKIGKKILEFEETAKDLKINAEKGIEEIKTVAISKIVNQEQIISKTIANIEDTNLKNKELIAIITEYDIPKRLEDIDNKLVNQFNQNKLIKKLLIVVLSLIGLGGIVAIGLIVKLL
jgi:antirestriction protein